MCNQETNKSPPFNIKIMCVFEKEEVKKTDDSDEEIFKVDNLLCKNLNVSI